MTIVITVKENQLASVLQMFTLNEAQQLRDDWNLNLECYGFVNSLCPICRILPEEPHRFKNKFAECRSQYREV